MWIVVITGKQCQQTSEEVDNKNQGTYQNTFIRTYEKFMNFGAKKKYIIYGWNLWIRYICS